ncbi:hypothetical protein AAE478_005982 [Parahypoxylon ruwenzoriense]
MAPTIDIIRHVVAEHNIRGSWIRDPGITAGSGWRQCESLARRYPYGDRVTHIVSSPMKRTIQTVIFGLAAALPRRRPVNKIILLPELQEVNATPSGTGRPKSELEDMFPAAESLGFNLDAALLAEDWYRKDSDTGFAPAPAKVEERARRARVFLRDLAREAARTRPDAHVVVMTHGEFAHWLTDDFEGVSELFNTDWGNGEFRSYQFSCLDDDDGDGRAALVETRESAALRRAGMEEVSAAKKEELKDIAVVRARRHEQHAAWEDEEEEEEEGWETDTRSYSDDDLVAFSMQYAS